MENLEIKVAIQIQKPAPEVFQAIVDPVKMCNYFIGKSTGQLIEGTSVTWEFPEFEGEVLIEVTKVIPGELISFNWEGAKGKKLLVKISLRELEDRSTVVSVTEGKMEADKAGIEWYGGNTEGWANFLACMKAYLEYGINLRKGAFEFRKGDV